MINQATPFHFLMKVRLLLLEQHMPMAVGLFMQLAMFECLHGMICLQHGSSEAQILMGKPLWIGQAGLYLSQVMAPLLL